MKDAAQPTNSEAIPIFIFKLLSIMVCSQSTNFQTFLFPIRYKIVFNLLDALRIEKRKVVLNLSEERN